MSFIHKSVWIQFFITLFIGYHYIDSFIYLYEANKLTNEGYTELLIFTAFQLVILNIAVHTIVAIFSNKDEIEQQRDERDDLIALKGSNAAYNLLSVWVMIIVVQLWLKSIPGAYYYFEALSAEFNVLNMLLVGFLLAEIIRFSTKLYHYHKGA
ncbi:hypothetical protein HII17_06855 [Thalassotalea sp. M1531]|uniref:Uncharacterized protein n=1 Tax=Thalassotalea algicola TaxID=2716224 RepID=A0A7Y0LB35_9GAMM|nr:hypothetical protein [Thalassotalea algicola]NMP31275.1 hypothetical protein [Thalassotalea algicola]